jgi:hypothetical protein
MFCGSAWGRLTILDLARGNIHYEFAQLIGVAGALPHSRKALPHWHLNSVSFIHFDRLATVNPGGNS